MKNKNGFTLIEIIAVIAIIGLLLTMVTPKLMENYNDKKNKLYDATIKEIERLSKLYLTDNPNLYTDISSNGNVDITIEMLCNEKYLDCPVNNPKDNSNIKGYVKVSFEDNNYVYEFIDKSLIKIVTLDVNGGGFNFVTFVEPKEHIYTVPESGKYKLEVWGAQGGNANDYIGGYGGYSVGEIYLEKDTQLYINVGGQGEGGYPDATRVGGYNGGGTAPSSGDQSTNRYVAGGGGATHIAIASGTLSSLSSNKSSILIVAGGGGGGYQHTAGSVYTGIGGDAGGYVGKNGAGQANYGLGGSQTAAGTANGETSSGVGGFGYGGDAGSGAHGSGGGGGYYGGGGSAGFSGKSNSSGGGGSGYIGNSLLTNKVMYCYNCDESTDESTKTISTTNVNENSKSNYAKIGDGAAKISRSINEIEVVYNTKLPTPIREGYTFLGWYTEANAGKKVTENTIYNLESDQTLYAHWEAT